MYPRTAIIVLRDMVLSNDHTFRLFHEACPYSLELTIERNYIKFLFIIGSGFVLLV